MKSWVKWFLVVAVIAVTFILPATLQSLLGNPKSTGNSQMQATETPSTNAVVVKSVPPASVKGGTDFTYRLSIDTYPEMEYSVVVNGKPDWLKWDESQEILSGTVPPGIGTFTATIVVTTVSGDSAEQKITVIVTKDEASVKGATTVLSSFDPFHPESEPTVVTATPTKTPEVSFEGIGTTPFVSQVLGETETRESKIQVDYLLYGAGALLILTIIYLLAKIVGGGRGEPKRTSSGIVIQSVRS